MKTQRCHQINKQFCCLITPAMMMIFMLYTTAAMALAPIKARYSEEAELVSIAAPTMRDFMPQYIKVINGFSF